MPVNIHLIPTRVSELELLARFDLDSRQAGIKIHHDAATDILTAAQGLHEKGMISQPDGGYLTDRGIELAERLQLVLSCLEAS
jgi:uncharacterized protein (TIGR02647 family)